MEREPGRIVVGQPVQIEPKVQPRKPIETSKKGDGGGGKNKTGDKRFVLFFIFAFVLCIGAVVGGIYGQYSRDLPLIISVEDYKPKTVTQVYTQQKVKDESGKEVLQDVLIGEFYKQRRYVIPYDKIPELVVMAFVAAEDDQFFKHQGVSLVAILRASVANFKAGHVVQGGSTITMQLARSLFLTQERSYIRKIKEAILASRIESNLTKEQILFLYLNQIYLGHGAYGVDSAARMYYNKSASDLNLAEIAVLAGMPKAPGKFSPLLNPKRAKERQLYVLRRMYESKFITQEQMLEAASLPIRVYYTQETNDLFSPYYVESIRRYLLDKYGADVVYEQGLKVYVAAKIDHFKAAKKALRSGLREVDKRRGYRGPIQTFETQDAVDKWIEEQRLAFVKQKVPYKIFLPDGSLGMGESLQDAGVREERDLLEVGEVYRAVVTEVNDRKKVAKVMVGPIEAIIPMKLMEWAHKESGARIKPPAPTHPSQVVAVNDLVLVRVVDDYVEESDKKKDDNEKPLYVSLEQEPKVEGALFSIDVKTGFVLASEGGYDFARSEFNRATQANRQPGSAFKPFIYAKGIAEGFTPATIIVDSPIIYEDDESGKWKPTNYGGRFYGDTTYRNAFIKSRNIPTIKLVQAVGVDSVIEYARRIGFTGHLNNDLSISLGSGTTTLKDLVELYALFPRKGRKIHTSFIRKVEDRDGKVLEEFIAEPLPDVRKILTYDILNPPSDGVSAPSDEPKGRLTEKQVAKKNREQKFYIPPYPLENDPDQVMDPRVAYAMTHLMNEVVQFGTGRKARALERPAAGKTGTTNESKDAWFMGFTPDVVTGVWIGFDDQAIALGAGETGGGTALPVWMDFMQELLKDYPVNDFEAPPGIEFAWMDSNTGRRVEENATNGRKQAFIKGTAPEFDEFGSGAVRPQIEDTSGGDFLKEDFE